MRNLTWLAALALAIGCATQGGETRQQSATVTAQSEASQSFAQAAQAQQRATAEQQKAEEAHRNVIAAEKQLADAQAHFRGQQARAAQAQADATHMAEVANEQGAMSQQQAVQAQQLEAQQHQRSIDQNMRWTQPQDVQGNVIASSNGGLSLRTDDARTLNLNVSDTTAVTLDGRAASVSQLMPGTDVRASYQMVDGQAQALKIRAHSAQPNQ